MAKPAPLAAWSPQAPRCWAQLQPGQEREGTGRGAGGRATQLTRATGWRALTVTAQHEGLPAQHGDVAPALPEEQHDAQRVDVRWFLLCENLRRKGRHVPAWPPGHAVGPGPGAFSAVCSSADQLASASGLGSSTGWHRPSPQECWGGPL